MTTAMIALLVALAAIGIVLVSALLQRRARAGSDERIREALARLGTRMDDLSHDLQSAIERVHADGARSRALDDLGSSLDLDEVLARAAEAAASAPNVDAVVVRAVDLDGAALVATVGIPAGEAERQAVSFAPDGRPARAVATTYVYGEGVDPPGALRSGVAVPLEADGEQLGFLAVYSHDPAPAVSHASIARLEAIATAAGPAIDAARRYREARQLTDEDSLTGLANRRAFHDSLSREVARGHRYDRRLAVLLLDVDDFKGVNARVGQLGGDQVLSVAADRVREAVRGADTAYRIGGDEFAVILPESTWVDAEGLYARVTAALGRDQVNGGSPLTMSAGIAELQPEDDVMSLLQRADGALTQAKARAKGTPA